MKEIEEGRIRQQEQRTKLHKEIDNLKENTSKIEDERN